MRKLLVASQKSGVGKTTTSMNLAAAAVRKGTRVLLLDADPLSNIASALNLAAHPNRRVLRQVGIELPGVLTPNVVPGLDVLSPYDEGSCSDEDFDRLLQALTTPMARQYYGCLLVDAPPFMGANPAQLIGSCEDYVLVMRAEASAYRTLPAFLELVQRSNRNGHSIQMRGILLTLVPGDDPGCRWERELRGRFGARILPEVIPHDETIEKAVQEGQIGCHVHPDSPAARSFRQLASRLGLLEVSCPAATVEKITQALREAAAEVGPAAVSAPASLPAAASVEAPADAEKAETPAARPPEPEPTRPTPTAPLRPRRLGRSGETLRPRLDRTPPSPVSPVPPSGRIKKVAVSLPSAAAAAPPAPPPPARVPPVAPNGLGQLWPLWILLGALLGGSLRFVPPSSSMLPVLVGVGVAVLAIFLLRNLSVTPDRTAARPVANVQNQSRPRELKKPAVRPETKKDPIARLASLTTGLPKSTRRDPNPN